MGFATVSFVVQRKELTLQGEIGQVYILCSDDVGSFVPLVGHVYVCVS